MAGTARDPAGELIPPQSLEAEQAVLGAMLIEPQLLAKAAGMLHARDFFRRSHQMIWEGMIELHKQGTPADLLTLFDRLVTRDRIDSETGRVFLASLINACPAAGHWEHYAEIVLDRAGRRRAISSAAAVAKAAYDEQTQFSPEIAADLLNQGQESRIRSPPAERNGAESGDLIILPTIAQLMAKTIQRPRWIVEGLLPEGFACLFGRPKMRKSFLMMASAVSVATGGKALGYFQVEKRGVLYLALEDPEWRLQDRVMQTGLDVLTGIEFYYETRWERFDKGGGKMLSTFLDQHPSVGYVVVDTFAKVKPRQTSGTSVYDQDYEVGAYFKQIADDHHVCLTVVHHTRKAVAEDWLDSINGSTGIAGSADTLMLLQANRGENTAKLRVTGRDVETEDYHLEWQDACAGWIVAGKAEEYAATKERQQVLELMKLTGGSTTPPKLAEAAGKKQTWARLILWRMKQADEISGDGEGVYWLRPVS